MMNKLFLIIVLIIASSIHAFESNAKYAVLMDYDTGSIIYDKNAHISTAPSSMSKLMTAYVVFGYLKNNIFDLNDKFTISKKAWSKGGSKMFVGLNSDVTIEDLLYGLIVQSGNDATIALAEGVAGTENDFVTILNDTAKKLKLNDSNFVNATGWPDKNHKMSAADIAILSRALIKEFPDYYHMFSRQNFTYNKIKQFNRNPLLGGNIGVDGLKTGQTEIAGYGLVASSKRGERRLISVINGVNSKKARKEETERLLKYGYNNFANVQVAKAGQPVTSLPIFMGKLDEAEVTTEQDVILTAANYQLPKIKAEVKYKTPIKAPLKKGDKIAKLLVTNLDGTTQKYDLVAARDYKLLSYFGNLKRKYFKK